MLRKADEHLTTQSRFETEAQAKLSSARQKRQEDRDRQEAIEVHAAVTFRILLLTVATFSPAR